MIKKLTLTMSAMVHLLSFAPITATDQDTTLQEPTFSSVYLSYLKRFPIVVKSAHETQEEALIDQNNQKSFVLRPITVKSQTLTADGKRKALITAVGIEPHDATLLTPQTIEKLNLLYAKSGDSVTKQVIYNDGYADTLTKQFNSELAKVTFIEAVTCPTDDSSTIKERQNFIITMSENNTSIDILKNHLSKAATYEDSIATLWSHSHEFIPSWMRSIVYWENGSMYTKILPSRILHKFDRTPLTLLPAYIDVPLHCMIMPGIVGTTIALSIALPVGMAFAAFKGELGNYCTALKTGVAMGLPTAKRNLTSSIHRVKNTVTHPVAFAQEVAHYAKNKPQEFTLGTLYAALIGWEVGMATYNIENHFKQVQKYFIDFAAFLEEIRTIGNILRQTLSPSKIETFFPEFKALLTLDNKKVHSDDFNQLLKLLKTSTFKGSASKLSLMGRVKCAYKLFENVKSEFQPILRAIGLLQLYHELAELMHRSEDQKNSFCFAQFVHEGPYLKADAFWNPMVGQDKAVYNDFIITPEQKDCILHGPNTGGKTTTIKGLMYNILLAQTFGIAAAREFILSPFSHINCFMDIQDDVTAGSSLFDAEVRFATDLYNRTQTLQHGQYAFTIADEILRSTSPAQGQAYAYQFTKKLATHPGSASITVSHYPKLVELAKEGFRTFYVEIYRDAQGKVVRTFKLKEGITHENIAGDILKEHGVFTEEDILQAEELHRGFATQLVPTL